MGPGYWRREDLHQHQRSKWFYCPARAPGRRHIHVCLCLGAVRQSFPPPL